MSDASRIFLSRGRSLGLDLVVLAQRNSYKECYGYDSAMY